MSRGLSATNQTEVAKNHVQVVLMVNLAFDTPAYFHTGIGNITYGGNTYLGVGDFGGVDGVEESESISPSPIRLSLSGIDSTLISECLNSGRYGDRITIYEGYRQDDGTLVDDPWILASGTYEFGVVDLSGDDSGITITMQHDLAMLDEIEGSRFTDEDQQQRFAGDLGLSFVADSVEKVVPWGGGVVRGNDLSDRTDRQTNR